VVKLLTARNNFTVHQWLHYHAVLRGRKTIEIQLEAIEYVVLIKGSQDRETCEECAFEAEVIYEERDYRGSYAA
jgi:hypothetical protein